MSAIAVVTAALGGIALLMAALNLFVFALRRADRGHLWLAVAAFGVVLCALPAAWIYGSESVAEALAARRAILFGLWVLSLGFVRFSESLLGVGLRWVERVATATLAFLLVASFVPGLTFTGRPLVRSLPGSSFVDAEITSFGALILLVFLALAARMFAAYLGHRDGPDTALRRVPGAVLLWSACTLGDLAAGAGLVDLPSLLPLGHLGFVTAFTAARIRRFVAAMAACEVRALLLERLVDEHTQALREKELQLAHGERLAAAGTLAAGIAHEINNPIAFVLANLNHLQALRKEDESGAEMEEVLLETQEGVARLRGIVDELLRLARTGERGSEPVDLARVVESVLPMLRHEASQKVRIQTELALAPRVLGDPRLLGQVVLNLLQNAIHSLTDARRDGCVRVSVRPAEESVELCVEDDGPGIPESVRPHIFDPFFTTKSSGKGTGLGLAVTREIVSRHLGRIEVESGSDRTRFRVTLPAARP